MRKIIQWKSNIHQNTLKIMFITFKLAKFDQSMAPTNMFQQKVHAMYYIVLEKPILNEQLGRKVVTWLCYNVNILTSWVFKFLS